MTNEEMTYEALGKLKEARDLLKRAGAVKTLRRVVAAISSAKGAVRNAGYKKYRGA